MQDIFAPRLSGEHDDGFVARDRRHGDLGARLHAVGSRIRRRGEQYRRCTVDHTRRVAAVVDVADFAQLRVRLQRRLVDGEFAALRHVTTHAHETRGELAEVLEALAALPGRLDLTAPDGAIVGRVAAPEPFEIAEVGVLHLLDRSTITTQIALRNTGPLRPDGRHASSPADRVDGAAGAMRKGATAPRRPSASRAALVALAASAGAPACHCIGEVVAGRGGRVDRKSVV